VTAEEAPQFVLMRLLLAIFRLFIPTAVTAAAPASLAVPQERDFTSLWWT